MIAITSDATTITSVNGDTRTSARASIESVELLGNGSAKGTYIEVRFSSINHWTLDMDGNRGDACTINAATPANNAALHTAIAALIL